MPVVEQAAEAWMKAMAARATEMTLKRMLGRFRAMY